MVDTVFRVVSGSVSRLRRHLALCIVAVPMALVALYLAFLSVDRYVSESRIMVLRSGDLGGSLVGISLPFFSTGGSGNREDALHLVEFIRSPDMLERLEAEFGLREEVAFSGKDPLNRLFPWASREDFLQIYRKRVELGYDEKHGVLVIRTQANDPERAQKINLAVLREAERFINDISRQIAREQLDFSQQELQRARKSLDGAKENLVQFQNMTGMVNPAASVEMSSRVIGELEGQLAAKEVELNTMSSVLQDNAAQIVSLRQTIGSLRQQINAERKKLASVQDDGLNRVASRYLEHKAVVDFQADIYKVSLAALEKTRVETARKMRSVAVLSSPKVPETAEYPHRAYNLAAWLLGLCVLYGLIRLAIEIIEDHRD